MPTYIAELSFLEKNQTQVVAIAAIFAQEHRRFDELIAYLARDERVLISVADFVDVLEIARAGRLNPVIAKMAQTVGPHLAVCFHIVDSRASRLGDQRPNMTDPAMIIFNTAENWEVYQNLRYGDDPVIDLVGLSLGSPLLHAPATVGVIFGAWEGRAEALVDRLETCLILSRPPRSIQSPERSPAFLLMADPKFSLNHVIDPWAYRMMPEVEMRPEHDNVPVLFRKGIQDTKAQRYLGPAEFTCGIERYEKWSNGRPEVPAIRRIMEVACDTALADVFEEGRSSGGMPADLRRQSGIPDVSQYGSYAPMRAKVLGPLVDAVHKFRCRNGDELTYPIVKCLAESFAVANELDKLDPVARRWTEVCSFEVPPDFQLSTWDLPDFFQWEVCR